MRGRITKKAVDGLEPGATGEAVMWDDRLSGFGVRARAGGAKTYLVHYRAGGGRGAPLRKYTIGKHGSPWTAEEARDEAERILGRVALGEDPAAERMDDRKAETVADLIERFLKDHAEDKKKERTAKEYRRLLEKHAKKPLGKLKAADVTRAQIQRLHTSMRDTSYQANRVLAVLRKMFNFARPQKARHAFVNPCEGIEPFKEHGRERLLSGDELAALGMALAELDKELPYAVAAVRLLLFTGARRSEILGLRWEWVDFERAEARLPDSKTGAKTLHLSPPALAVLAGLERIEGNPHVIAGRADGAALVNIQKPWDRIRKRAAAELQKTAAKEGAEAAARAEPVAAALAETRIHDLRHAFASVGAASGMGLPIIGKMLGHSQPATTARYAHLASDPVKAAAAAVAGKIADAMSPARESGSVVELRKGARS